jgi:chemotaxis protein CheX
MSATAESLVPTIDRICSDIFETMIKLPFGPEENPDAAPSAVMAIIGISGPRKHCLVLQTSSSTACRIAGALLATDYPDYCDDVRDAVGELCNMVGGNFKTTLGPGYNLSMPTVITGEDVTWKPPVTLEVLRRHYRCGEGVLRVLLASEPEA